MMRRRDFLTAVGGSALALGSKGTATASDGDSGKLKIGYIRPEIPHIGIPAYGGTHYEDRVPDTLDIAERARLTLNALTAITDPNADYEIYFHLAVFRNPVVISHDFSDWCQESEGFVEALPLMRVITGDRMNSEVDRAWTDVILKSIGPDGLFYFPTQGRPWFYKEGNIDMSRFVPTIVLPSGPGLTSDRASYTQFTHPQPAARLLGALTIYGLRDKNPMWAKTAERMIDGWAKLTTDKGKYAYFPRAAFAPGAKSAPQLPMPLGIWSTEASGRFIQGLAQCYRVSGYEPARRLAAKLVYYQRYEGQQFDPNDGRFLADRDRRENPQMEIGGQGAIYGGHFHGHTIGLLAMLDYAIAIKDQELIDYIRKSFEWAKDHPESIDLLGYFPTQLVPSLKRMVTETAAGPVETCEVADMIALGVKLSQAGAGDYWDNVDHWLRNQFFENQLTSAEWLYRFAETQDKMPVQYNESADHPAERNLGGFSGWSAINDWVVRHKQHRYGIMHCCTGNAARAIYYTWENMVDHEDGTLRVHLLMNHASPWADVYSYIPYRGRVDVKLKKACPVTLLRVPEGIDTPAGEISCTVNGAKRSFAPAGRYIKLGPLAPGDRVTMTFPISERTVKVNTMGVDYSLVMKGSTVVSIEPGGTICPYYQRAAYRRQEVPWRQVKRFVSDQIISW